ncbi:hypothetical protein, partial [Shewanella sp.]|uniref:hypothetical protein n=1 Tax=Shewanella sp. TaxID=50422 RepID=UPI004047C110
SHKLNCNREKEKGRRVSEVLPVVPVINQNRESMPAIKRTASGALKRSSSFKKRKPYPKKSPFYPRSTNRKTIVNLGTTIPDATVVKLKYCDDLNISVPATVNGANYLIRCNSIYDPDSSSVGHQPLGHDQWSAFYQRYVVTKATLTATFKSSTGDPTYGSNVGICIIANPGETIGLPDTFMENNRTSYAYNTKWTGPSRITKVFHPNLFFGNDNIIDDDSKGALFGANPADQAYFQMKMWSPNQSSPAAHTVYVNIAVTYECVLRERKEITSS